MRLDVYAEEITGLAVITKIADTGNTFIGLRVYLKSPAELHHSADADDSSAVTFWFANQEQLASFRDALIDMYDPA